MKQRLAEIAYQVLRSFRDNSSYNDYLRGDEPFTDAEYQQVLDDLYPMAFSAPKPQEGVTSMRLTLDVHYYNEDDHTKLPSVGVCAELLQSIVTQAVDNGDLSGDYDFVVADYPYHIDHLTSEGFVQILPKPE